MSVRAVQPVIAAIEVLGHEVDDLFEEAGIPRSVLRNADGFLEKLPRETSLAERMRVWLNEEISGGTPSVASAARALHISVRTLHRGLQEEGTSFRELLDQLRQERATALLANPRCSIAEAGFLLGFAELSSFSRAFKRWTGKSPATFREEILSSS